MFDLDQFVADLRATLAERSRAPMRDVVARAVSDPASLLEAIGEPAEPGVRVLHAADDLTVLNVVWSPLQITLPHNHRMTAVIGMYGGREDNVFWRRVPDAARGKIEVAGGQALSVGETALLGPDIVHSVVNPLSRLSGAIHVYDGAFLTIERSMWDPETLTEEPFDIVAVTRGTPLRR